MLADVSRQLDPEGVGVRIVSLPPESSDLGDYRTRRITYRFENASFEDVFKCTMVLLSARFRIEERRLVVYDDIIVDEFQR